MEEQKLFVDYLAYISDADDLSKELDWTFKIIKDKLLVPSSQVKLVTY